MFSWFRRKPDMADVARALGRHGIAPELAARLLQYAAAAPRAALWHANPRHLAEQLAADERATLSLLLAAVQEGLMRLHWDVQCPKCGAISHRGESLALMHRVGECPMCRLVFPQRLDVEVRVTFSAQALLRAVGPGDDDPDFRQTVDERLGPVPGQALLVLPEFQALFPQEKLLPDESLEVARAAFVFTDLAGSTALYAAQGDPRAFHLVRQHFSALFAAAAAHGGTVVKTVGDAVMAVFPTPVQALAAALAMQTAVADLNGHLRLGAADQLILKVGVHSGACLHVTLNERLDYFGTTVNMAARVQGLSRGRDVVFTDAVYQDRAAQALLTEPPAECWSTSLKGLDGECQLYRTLVAAPVREA